MTDAELDACRRDTGFLHSVISRQVHLKREGNHWKGCCPFHADRDPSFAVYDNGFHCFACGAKGTVVDYVMLRDGVDVGEAIKRIGAERGISPQPKPKPKPHPANGKEEWFPIVPPPSDAPKPTDEQLRCDMLREYCGPNDVLLFYLRRVEVKGNRRKQFYPLTWGTLVKNGRSVTGWHNRAPAAPRPLYRLNALSHADANATVLLCEGEKSAEAAQRLFPDMIAMTWLGGSSADSTADFTPLQGRHVVLWPDADQPGRDVMARIAKRLPQARVINTEGLPDGYDAADLEYDSCDDPETWLQSRLREPEREHILPEVEWRDARLSDWANRDVPERLWIVPDWIPREQTTGLYGIGGINKTDFLMQLLMASSKGLPFLGYELAPIGPVYGLFCEDSEAELVRRASRIAAHYGLTLADFPDVHFASLVGYDDPEFMSFDGPKPMNGPALLRFDRMIVHLGAKLATLDTAPDFFGGTEISRRDVTRFVRKLDAVSITRSCAILFSAHPSVRGRASGSFDSGSTGWEAKVRARLSLHDPGNEDDLDGDNKAKAPQPPSDRRILTRQKANYARPGATIELVCREGVFTPAAVDPEAAKQRQHGPGHAAACEDKFLELLAKVREQGGYVHDASNVPSRYAPAVFATRPDGKAFSKAEYTRAMQRLFVAKRLRLQDTGKGGVCLG
jgi:RecA-family ATPase